jgi:hypothetical protein
MPKTVAKRIFTEIKDETNPMNILAAIKYNLPEQFFKDTASAKDVSMSIPNPDVRFLGSVSFISIIHNWQCLFGNHCPPELKGNQKVGTATPLLPDLPNVGTPSPQSEETLVVPGEKILSKLSYSHLEQLIGIEDTLKRAFWS